jgi:predicted ATP-binding protein involved in virulence
MKLESLHLKNFRCFSDLSITFDKQLTVFVGKNGAGKTAVLDALAIFLRAMMEKQGMPANHYPHLAANVSDATISADGIIDYTIKFTESNFISFHFKQNIPGSQELELYKSSFSTIIGDIMQSFYNEYALHGVNIFAFYGAQRCLPQDYQNESATKGRNAIFQNAFSPRINFMTSLSWFDEKDAEEARRRSNTHDFEYKDSELTAVRQAITKALGENLYDFPHMDGTPPKLYINNINDGLAYKVTQLSDGYKTMLAVIMDLSRRMAAANAEIYAQSGKSVLETPAIVLIDEVELHLHPAWQQTVLPSLMDIFPNTQFIVTTHSPQVLTSIEPKHIRILKDGQPLQVDTITYGTESTHVLNEIFGVSSRPNNEATKMLDEYLALINDGQGMTPTAQDMRRQLERWLLGDPILTQADMFIRRNERRKERETDSHA